MKEKFRIAGIKKILLTWHKHADLLDAADPARALGPPAENGSGRKRPEFSWSSSSRCFSSRTSRRRTSDSSPGSSTNGPTGMANTSLKRGNRYGTVCIVRDGVVEIMRRKRNGEEVSLVLVEPPASFEELAATGAVVVHWISARARGPVVLGGHRAVPTWMTSVVTFHFWRIKFSRIWPISSP